jgi:FixJ family two-component response regulator
MNQPCVIIVEDDVALRLSLSDWLSTEYSVICFESAEAFMEEIHRFESGEMTSTCLLLDFQMEGMTGVELQAKLLQRNVRFPVIFMSGNAQQADIIDAWRGGAIDFLLKPFTGSKVSETLASVFQRSDLANALHAGSVDQTELKDLPISQREAEVLLLLGQGHRQHEIAKMLNISLRTVKWHRFHIKNKLNLNTLVELTRYCDQHSSAIKKVAKSHTSS